MFRFLVAAGAAMVCAAPIAAQELPRPNILLILADDLGAEELGTFIRSDDPARNAWKPEFATPNIDALASRGISYTNAYSQPICVQTRTALMTGKYPQRASVGSVVNNGPPPAGSALMIPEWLRDRGYHTALVGKWHLGTSAPKRPGDQGFLETDWYKGTTPNYWGHDPDAAHYIGAKMVKNIGSVTDNLTQSAINLINRPMDKNKFIYLSYTATHDPFQNESFAQVLRKMDDGIGRVVAAAETQGNWLIFFAGDNGRFKPGHFRGKKRDLWENAVRVPFSVTWTGHVPPTIVESPVTLIDVASTIAGVLGESWPEGDGYNLLGDVPADREIYWRAVGANVKGLAVRKGCWKYYQDWQGTANRLFDVCSDSKESKNIWGQTASTRSSGGIPNFQALVSSFAAHLKN